MDFGKAFTFPFEDPDWVKKLGIAAAIILVSLMLSVVIVGLAGFILLGGWVYELVRRVINRDPRPLPEWDDFGAFFMNGLKVWVVGLVYGLPVILVSACQQALTFGLSNQNGGDSTTASAIAMVALCLSCFSFLYGIFLAVIVPAAIGNMAATGQMSSAFRFSEVFGLVRAAPAAYVMVLLGGIVAGIISGLGIILCVIGVVATMAYASVIQGHLYGQAYNAANQARGGLAPVV
jgi:hypothetical protein